jgi:DNA gyrase subunit B
MGPGQNGPAMSAYTAKSISVLEGLEAVRKRPACTWGRRPPGPAPPRLGGRRQRRRRAPRRARQADHGHVCSDGGVEVTDDGRGIPVEKPRRRNASPPSRSCSPSCTPGASSTSRPMRCRAGCTGWACRSSTRCRREDRGRGGRDGKRHRDPSSPRQADEGAARRRAAKRTGTTVRFWPDPDVFDEVEFDADTVAPAARDRPAQPRSAHRRPRRADGRRSVPVQAGLADFVAELQRGRGGLLPKPVLHQPARRTVDGKALACDIAVNWSRGLRTSGCAATST